MSASPPRTPSVPAPAHQLDTLLAEAATHSVGAPAERDAKGRFAKGNPGGPGNPFARHVAKLRSALVQCVGEEDMQHIAKGLLSNARLGHLPSIRILLMYVLGKPSGAVNPDTLDIDEWRQLVQPLARIAAELPEALMTVPAATATDMVRSAQPRPAHDGRGDDGTVARGVRRSQGRRSATPGGGSPDGQEEVRRAAATVTKRAFPPARRGAPVVEQDCRPGPHGCAPMARARTRKRLKHVGEGSVRELWCRVGQVFEAHHALGVSVAGLVRVPSRS
jgi:hypothetical protein